MINKKNDPAKHFKANKAKRISDYSSDTEFNNLSMEWTKEAFRKMYMYNFLSFGRPIIQLPSDIMAMSELIWEVRPEIIVETGIAHGGSIIHNAGQLALLDIADAERENKYLDISEPKRKIIAIDIDIRPHNKTAIEEHPFSNRITMIEGSSVDLDVINEVRALIGDAKKVLVCLDSNHTHEHVVKELMAYAPMTTQGSYCVVFDTIIENLPKNFFVDRPWNPGNSPMSAIDTFLRKCKTNNLKGLDGNQLKFKVDNSITDKLLVTAAPGGFLYRET